MDLRQDNWAENAALVGFNSERSIRFGGPTTDEMDLAWINIAQAKTIVGPISSQDKADNKAGD